MESIIWTLYYIFSILTVVVFSTFVYLFFHLTMNKNIENQSDLEIKKMTLKAKIKKVTALLSLIFFIVTFVLLILYVITN
ncbi:MAG: hypothetical protein FWC41_04520 [Firmicutes bacterium]|nr:hypothetical protein [Bacillota bacterium]